MIVGSAGHRQISKLYMKAQNLWGSPQSLAQSRFNKRSPHCSAPFTSLCTRLLNRSPKLLVQDFIVAALSAGSADPDGLIMQPGYEVGRGELTALVGVEDLWLTASCQRDLQSLKTECGA